MTALAPTPEANSLKKSGMSQFHTRKVIRFGYIRLLDAVPFLVASQLGYFEKYNINVRLIREPGWATIRDKMIFGELDVCHALGPMPFAMNLGLFGNEAACHTSMFTSSNGNALTLSSKIPPATANNPDDLRHAILSVSMLRKPIFGIVSSFSSHLYLLRKWLTGLRINPDRDVKIVVLPPDQMCRNLRAGHIDGFCAGEPWNTLASEYKFGWTAATSWTIDAFHPEKCLMASRDFVCKYRELYICLIAALLDSCQFCDDYRNTDAIDELTTSEYSNPLKNLDFMLGAEKRDIHKNLFRRISNNNKITFYQKETNYPSPDKAMWILNGMKEAGQLDDFTVNPDIIVERVLSPEFYEEALDFTK